MTLSFVISLFSQLFMDKLMLIMLVASLAACCLGDFVNIEEVKIGAILLFFF
jgi:hypothetical protein